MPDPREKFTEIYFIILMVFAFIMISFASNKPRVKENAQQASSSRAAEIIATSGQAPIQNLGGFAQFLGGTAFSSTSTLAASDIDSAVSNATLDPELVLVLKRLSKRDPITKLKALEEFESYLKSKERNENELTGILDLWTKLFVKLEIDVDRRIRYATYSYVARVANESFQEEILSYITNIILYKTPETLSDPRFTSKEDMVSKYLGVVASSYYSLAHIISQLKEDELGKSAQQYDNLYSENNDDDDNFENKNDDYDFKSNDNDNDFEDENVSSIPLQSEIQNSKQYNCNDKKFNFSGKAGSYFQIIHIFYYSYGLTKYQIGKH
ncbi:hypothetical protein RhiirA4_471186 [Rhizophagus irregularis]|uniref:E3 ubiquitin-protein ligase listerin n=1 Tax=Rhizophagus irregularis TaxID=588596 RepID=A0A2I1H2N7_9GLOM|nr:hypothetical protein RhiirA4_471186 [Rhizophagus irregularis]